MKPFLSKSMPGLLALGLIVCAPLHDARSQPASASAVGQDADQLFQKGKVLYQAGKYREAYDALRGAWASKKSFDIAGNLGTVELVLNMPRDAAEHLAYGIRTFPSTGNKKHLATTKQQFEEARAQVGALTIKVNVEGAEVLIDGKAIGRSPIVDEIFVVPGERTIEVKLAGYETAKQIAKVAKGGSQAMTLSLAPALIPPPPPVASVMASAGPAVSASASAGPPPVPSGSTAPIVPVVAGGPSKPVLITGGVVTGLAVVAGVVFTAMANGKASDADIKLADVVKQRGGSACAQADAIGCVELHDARTAQQTLGSAAAWSFIGAGAVGMATIAYALLAPKATTSGMVVAPVVTGTQGGLVLGGSF